MSAIQNLTVVRRFFEEYCNQRRADLADALMTPDSRYIDPQSPDYGAGPQAMTKVVSIYQQGVEGHWQIDDLFAAGDDRVVCLWTGTGRHTGDVMGIPPTGKPIRVSAISVLKLRDGKIAEHHCIWDTLGFLQQIGVVQAPGQAPARQQTKAA